MSADPARYEVRGPDTLDQVLALLAGEPGEWRPLAGGTDLMVLLESGQLRHRRYVSLGRVAELRRIDVHDQEVVIGARTTYTDVRRHPVVRAEFPLLCAAAAETGGIATQNRGTLGGNIANASPAADTPPALLVYDAELDLMSARGTHRVAYERFHTGYKTMDLAPDELIAAIRLRRGRSGWVERYRKVGTRRAQAISKVCLAAGLHMADGVVDEVRIALGSVAPTVVRARHAEAAIRGRAITPEAIRTACDALGRDVAPIDDVRSTARYRERVARSLLEAFLVETT